MTLTPYAEVYEARQRDPVIDRINRASVANGRMSRWERFNRNVELVYVDDAEGTPRALTPKQYAVLGLAREMIDGPMLTMRDMALRLSVAPSTVSRALTKLAAWGLLVYIVGRGRWAGLVIVRYIPDGGWLTSKRKAAQARVRRWKEAAERRFSRLAFNVAPYLIDGGRGLLTTSHHPYSSTRYMGATLTVQRSWTADEVADIV